MKPPYFIAFARGCTLVDQSKVLFRTIELAAEMTQTFNFFIIYVTLYDCNVLRIWQIYTIKSMN